MGNIPGATRQVTQIGMFPDHKRIISIKSLGKSKVELQTNCPRSSVGQRVAFKALYPNMTSFFETR